MISIVIILAILLALAFAWAMSLRGERDEAITHVHKLSRAMKRWGQHEDGVPHEFFDDWARATAWAMDWERPPIVRGPGGDFTDTKVWSE